MLLVGVTMVGFVACDDDDEENGKSNGTENVDNGGSNSAEAQWKTAVGSIKVSVDTFAFTTDSAKVEYRINNNGQSFDMKIVDIKFVPQMPVSVTPELMGVPCTKIDANSYEFGAESLIPTMGGNPVEKYTAKEIKGTVQNSKLKFSLKFGDFPTEFEEYK